MQEFHKGGLCVHKILLCQESDCSECHIHQAALHLKEHGILNVRQVKEERSMVLVSSSK